MHLNLRAFCKRTISVLVWFYTCNSNGNSTSQACFGLIYTCTIIVARRARMDANSVKDSVISVLISGPNCNFVISVESRDEIVKFRVYLPGFYTSSPARRRLLLPSSHPHPPSPATNRRRRRAPSLVSLSLRPCDGGDE